MELILPSSDVDSLSLYSILYDIASSNNDIDGLKTYKVKYERLLEQILRNDFESYILETEKKYDNEILSGKLKISRNRIIALSSICLLVFAAFVILYLVFRDRARKREIILRDAVSDLQLLRAEILARQNEATELQSLIRENESVVASLKRQMESETEELRNLRDALLVQMSSNQELLSLNGDLLGMTKTIADICYVYKDSPNMPGKVEEALKSLLSDGSTIERIEKMFELTYPGFIAGLRKQYTSLNDNDCKLISLVCCGFTPNTSSIIIGTSVQSLNAKKYRLARKMGIDGRLSSFLKKKISEYKVCIVERS